ncbi:hypothetical protein BJ165DRAFT_1508481, partial [Panaeolus papilionaceus]
MALHVLARFSVFSARLWHVTHGTLHGTRHFNSFISSLYSSLLSLLLFKSCLSSLPMIISGRFFYFEHFFYVPWRFLILVLNPH